MIDKCTSENLLNIINYAKDRKLVYFRVEKHEQDFLMEYNTLNDIDEIQNRIIAENVIKNSLRTTFALIERLEQLKTLVDNDIIPSLYTLKYDVTQSTKYPIFNVNTVMPEGYSNIKNKKKKVEIDWNSVFEDKLNEIVPSIYSKKSAKKYIPITYKELIDIIS